VVFLIFLVINIAERSRIFGAIAGMWLLVLGLFIIVDGIQTESGITIDDTGDTTSYEYQFIDVTLPYSTYSIVWGIVFIGISIYILYANLLK
jgi:hypothetical protein